ncbi:hypothetical protein IW82_001616 [Salmonella enterica subsp. enterica serovar Braenderup]|nr:hypothetical protein [Salmonella enterica subsp. enterica serovar Braenderup]
MQVRLHGSAPARVKKGHEQCQTSLRWHYPDQVVRVFLTNFCYQLIINIFFSSHKLKTSKLTTQLTTHFVEALRTTTNNNKQMENLLVVLLNRHHFPAIRYEAGG